LQSPCSELSALYSEKYLLLQQLDLEEEVPFCLTFHELVHINYFAEPKMLPETGLPCSDTVYLIEHYAGFKSH
jgi:glycogen synthase